MANQSADSDKERGKDKLLRGTGRFQSRTEEAIRDHLSGWYGIRVKLDRGRVKVVQVIVDEQILLDGETPAG